MAVTACYVKVRRVMPGYGKAVKVSSGRTRPGRVWHGTAVEVWLGKVRFGLAQCGLDWSGRHINLHH